MIFGRLQPLPLNLFLCALGAHPRDGTGRMTSFTYFFASNSKSIQTLRIYRMSTKCWPWPSTANTERLWRCTRKFVHHVWTRTLTSWHCDLSVPRHVLWYACTGAPMAAAAFWIYGLNSLTCPSVPHIAMMSNKELPSSLAHADHMVARFVQTQQEVIAIACKRAECTLLQPTPTSRHRWQSTS